LGLLFTILVGAVYFYATRDPDLRKYLLAGLEKGRHLDFGKQIRASLHVHRTIKLPFLGETTVRSIVGVVLVAISFGWWLSPVAPVAVAEPVIQDVAALLTNEILNVVLVCPDGHLVVAKPPTVPIAARRLAKQIPETAPPMLLVRKAISQGNYNLARKLLDEAASPQPLDEELAGQKTVKPIEPTELDVNRAQNEMYAGKFFEALVWYNSALAREPNNPDLLAQAAVASLNADDYRNAKQLISRAVKTCRQNQPEEAFRLATCLHIEAAVFTVFDYRYDLAEKKNRQAQDLWSDDKFSDNNQAKAASLNNQAVLCVLTGNMPGARSMNTWAVEEWGKRHKRSARLAIGLANEAMRLHVEGYYLRSQEVADQALIMLRNTLLTGHPVIYLGMNNSAVADLALNEYELAQPHEIVDLVSKFEETLGSENPVVAAAMNTVGDSYLAMALPAKARPYYENAIEISKASLGPKHPYMTVGLLGLAEVFYRQKRYDQARDVSEQARLIAEEAFGEEHPTVALCILMEAKILVAEGTAREARPHFEQALEIAKQVFGDVHPLVAESIAGLASLDDSPRTINNGIARYEEALKIYKQLLDARYDQHPAVASLLLGTAKHNAKRGEIEKAHEQLARCLQIQEKTLVPYDPQLADTLLAQADLLSKEKKPDKEKIKILEKRAKKIRENYVKENRRQKLSD
jgi:hypothetical protein